MLEYRDNINYMTSQATSIDDELMQLQELCKKGISDYELYQQIRNYIYHQIKINELAVTIIVDDLQELREKNPKIADIISYVIIHNTDSYQQIAEQFGCSKQYIYQLIQKYANDYVWLDNLLIIKGIEDSKNQNNRSIFFNNSKKTKKAKQPKTMFIIEEDGFDEE